MHIKESDFEMEQVKDAPFFDLSLLTIVNEGKSNERSEMKPVGFGLTFDAAIKYIVSYRLIKQEIDCTVSEFVEKYREETEKVKELLNKNNEFKIK